MKVGVFNRRTAAQAVLLVWAGSLAWLARRELGKDEAQTIAEATIRLNPEAHYFSVKAAGSQVGYASVTIDTVPGGFRLSEILALDVPEADSTRRVTRRLDLTLSRSLRLRTFSRTVSGGGLFEEFAGTIEGDTLLRMAERDARDRPAEEWTMTVPAGVVLPEVLPYRLAFSNRLEVGRGVTASVLDLATGTIAKVGFAATAESTFVVADSAIEQRGTQMWRAVTYDTVKAWRIEHATSGTPTVTWVDAAGGPVFVEAALGVRLERSAFELVSINYRLDLERRGAAAHRRVPGMATVIEAGVEPDSEVRADFRILSQPVERFLLPRVAWLAGGRQAATGDGVAIQPPRWTTPDSGKADFLEPVVGRAVAPEVATAAAAIAPGEDSALAVAAKLARWVAKSIRRDPSPDAPLLPRRVLSERRAGAEGIAALFVDLARARGIPARIVGGAAPIGSQVYGHTWAEVLDRGVWVAVDPTFGRTPASSSLVRVQVGRTGRAIELVPLVGSASIARAEMAIER